MSLINHFLHRRKYSKHPASGFFVSFFKRKNRPSLRFQTHEARDRRRRFVFATLGLFTLIVLALIFFKSPYFQIQKIKTSGQTAFTSDNATALLSSFLGQNIFFVNTNSIIAKIHEQYPTIKNLSISRELPDTIMISADDFRIAWVLTQVGSGAMGRYLLNTAGFVSGPATSENAIGFPLLELHTNKKLSAKTEVLSPIILEKIQVLANNIKSRFNQKVLKFKIIETAREVHLLLDNNWVLRFMLDQDLDKALNGLAEALRGQNISKLNFEYIDLRIPDKVFFKPE
ncbi:MAG: FtsQ-type POTRA domain-containing protein [Patescibacteria group bacterium]|nr:FtsQ-type POTRA domain-containing protein [Patescibacteria group bacterium]